MWMYLQFNCFVLFDLIFLELTSFTSKQRFVSQSNNIVLLGTNDRIVQAGISASRKWPKSNKPASAMSCMLQAKGNKHHVRKRQTPPRGLQAATRLSNLSQMQSSANQSAEKQQAAQKKKTAITDKNDTDSTDAENTTATPAKTTPETRPQSIPRQAVVSVIVPATEAPTRTSR